VIVPDKKAFEGSQHLPIRPSGLNFVLYSLILFYSPKKRAHFAPKRALSQDTKNKFEQIELAMNRHSARRVRRWSISC
jgi:hypothetical protein